MIRIFSILVGAFFSLALLLAFGTGAYSYVTEPPAKTVEATFGKHAEKLALSSNGVFGKFDRAHAVTGFTHHCVFLVLFEQRTQPRSEQGRLVCKE